jgi:ribosomal protein L12E/L44/L45/RPP1/RPP2
LAKLNATQYEMNAIKLLMARKSPELLSRLESDLFGTRELSSIAKLIALGYATTGRFPGWDDLTAEIDRRVTDPDKLKFLLSTLGSIKERDISGVHEESLIQHLDDHRKLRILVGGTAPLLDAVERKNIDEALAQLHEMYASVHASTAAFAEIDNHDMTRMTGKKVKFNFRKTGIGGIDRRGGRIEGGLMLIGAEAKAGKSTLAVQQLLYAYDNYEGSCAVFTYEQQASELRARILSARSNIDLGMIVSDLLTPEDRRKLRLAEVAHLCHLEGDMEDYVATTAGQGDEAFWLGFWTKFKPRKNRIYLMDNHPDWDQLFVQMDLLCKMKDVTDFVIDYPFLVPRGKGYRELASWEYALKMSQKLKSFASENKSWVTAPAQYDSTSGSLKFVKNAINDCDLFIALSQEEGDKDMPPAGAVTAEFKAYRNFLTIPDEPTLQNFKLLKRFDVS